MTDQTNDLMEACDQKPVAVILDNMAYAYRAFYGVKGLCNSKGEDTGAIFGYVKSLLAAINMFNPQFAVVAGDTPGGSFRNTIYGEYKAHRKEPPEGFPEQLSKIIDLIPLMGWNYVAKAGFEADDILGTLALQFKDLGADVVVLTPDKDLLQLVQPDIRVYRESSHGTPRMYAEKDVEEKLGVKPYQVADYLGLMGDASDNIPGVPKVGQKTAATLLAKYGSMESILESVPAMKDSAVKRNLIQFKEQGMLSKKLATLCLDVPHEQNIRDLIFRGYTMQTLERMRELEFESVIQEITGG